MSEGLLGEFFCYQLDKDKMLIVDPCEEAQINFELFRKNSNAISELKYRGKKTIVLKNNEKILPVSTNERNEFYEGLYFYYQIT